MKTDTINITDLDLPEEVLVNGDELIKKENADIFIEDFEDDFDYEVVGEDEGTANDTEKTAELVKESENEAEETANADKVDKKEHIVKRLIEDLPTFGVDFLIFAIMITGLELFVRYQVAGKISKDNFYFLLFIPAEAMFFSTLCGIFKNKIINRLIMSVVSFVITAYYIIQLVYHNNFGSFFSISMTGMGKTAMGNFWWALKDTLIASIWQMLIMAIPFVVILALAIGMKKASKQYVWLLHIVTLVFTCVTWILGVALLRLGGTERQSAYYVFHSSTSNTDTTSEKIGLLATSVLEGGIFYLGMNVETDEPMVASVNVEALTLTPTTAPAPVSTNAVSSNEPEFVPEPRVLEEIDFEALSELATDDDTLALCEYYATKPPTETNEYTGMFEGYNLIYITAESFSSVAIDPDVTPTLYMMANNGIVLNNYYNSFLNTTTNGEYAFLTSLWPNVSRYAACGTDVGSFPQSAEKFMPMGMGDLFKTAGAETFAYHNYLGYYYRRSYSWPNLGFDTMKFLNDGMTFTSYWPASDLEMMEQSIDDYIECDTFQTYYMTFSGHGPYTSSNYIGNKNYNNVKDLMGDRFNDLTYDAQYYLAGEYEFDQAMAYLLERLEEAGKLDNTVIVIAGDHCPYNLSESGRDSIAGYEIDNNFEQYHSTCIIYNAGMEEPIYVDTPCCNVDIYPTILNLFNIEYESRLLAGNDIFSVNGIHRARLYNGSFITDTVKYNAVNGSAEWLIDTEEYEQEELDEYLNAMIEYTESEYNAANKLLTSNFYLFVYYNSGLMTEEEYTEELEREQMAIERTAEDRAAEEAAAAAAEAAQAELEANGIDTDGDGIPDTYPEIDPIEPEPETEETPPAENPEVTPQDTPTE